MKKKLISTWLLGALVVTSTSVFVSCKDYDGDIADLQQKVAENEDVISALKDLSKNNIVITDVAKGEDGVSLKLTTSDGNVYIVTNGTNGKDAVIWTIGSDGYWYSDGVKTDYKAVGTDGKNGINGTDGTNAIQWTIGDDGYWYQNGVKTDKKAVGTDGQDGVNGTNAIVWTIGDDGYWYQDGVKTDNKAVGKDGESWTIGDDGYWYVDGQMSGIKASGNNGQNGVYYVPNAQGYFDLYENGQLIQANVIKWAEDGGINAAKTRKGLFLTGVEGYEDGIMIWLAPQLNGLVFIPDTYYWGIEATTVKTLKSDTFSLRPLFSYIKADVNTTDGTRTTNSEEIIGTKRAGSKENNITDYRVADGKAHERYKIKGNVSTTLDAIAKYHINPTKAYMDEETVVDVISKNKDYTRAKSSTAQVLFSGLKSGVNHDWNKTDEGILEVPLHVNGTVGTVETSNSNSGVTVFATQVKYNDTIITSDYAAVIQEAWKDLRIAHKPYNLSNNILSETGMLNAHCGECALAKYARFSNKGMHLFHSFDEAKEYVKTTQRLNGTTSDKGEGWDLVEWTKDKDLTELVETHYTSTSGNHDVLDSKYFNGNNPIFAYRFNLTSLKLGMELTNESAHAAIYQDPTTQHYMLHPQDPSRDMLGLPYDPQTNKTTNVVIGRVPLVRVELVYLKDNSIVDYAYLPIRITGETPPPPPVKTIKVEYTSSASEVNITRYNDCWSNGGSSMTLLETNWIDTENDFFSNKGLPSILHRQEFDGNADNSERGIYRVEGVGSANGVCADAQQYVVVIKTKDGKPDTTFVAVDNTDSAVSNDKFGKITYEQDASAQGTETSTFHWVVEDANEFRTFANAGITKVQRAIKLESNNNRYPDFYVIFNSPEIKLNDIEVKGDMELTKHIIKEYWYPAGSLKDVANFGGEPIEIHTNVQTPEENTTGLNRSISPYEVTDSSANGWKPRVMEMLFRNVFANNFYDSNAPVDWLKISSAALPAGNPFQKRNLKFDFVFADDNNGKTFKGKLDAGDPVVFTLSNKTASDATKRNLYASYVNPNTKLRVNNEKIAEITPAWDGTDDAVLQRLKVSLVRESAAAKALLNYVAHEDINQEGVIKATIAIIATNQSTAENTQIKFTENGSTKYCKFEIENNKFDVRFLRPITIISKTGHKFVDANNEGDDIQRIPLADILEGFTDWRGSLKEGGNISWKSYTSGDNLDYEAYYSPEDTTKFVVGVQKIAPGHYLMENANVKTDLNQAGGTPVSLSKVSRELILKLSDDGKYIEYQNNSATVGQFHIYIPVTVDYFWGTIYGSIEITVERTKGSNSRVRR